MIGNGTFMGGVIPRHVNINGEPHQLSYINRQEAGLLSDLGGAGKPVFGVPAYYEGHGAGEGTSAEGAVGPGQDSGTGDGPGAGVDVGADVMDLGRSFYSYPPDLTVEQAQNFTDMGLEAGLGAEELDYYKQFKHEPYKPPRSFFEALKDNLKDNPFSILSPTTLAFQSLFDIKGEPQMDPMGVVGNVANQPSMMDEPDNAVDSSGDYYQPEYIQPVATPTAVVENVAAPVVVAEAPIDNSLLMRPSTLNTAPANAPVDYSLLYPAQERRFQESYALRPGYYSGQLDTTGYQPISSLLI